MQLSDDGNSWTTVWSGNQPQSTLALQAISINKTGSHLRILGHGNNSNKWNSITEVNIIASVSDGGPVDPPVDPDQGGTPSANNSVPAINCTIEVSSVSDLESNTSWSISLGTTICLTNGTYRNVELSIGGAGTADLHITVAAKNRVKCFLKARHRCVSQAVMLYSKV